MISIIIPVYRPDKIFFEVLKGVYSQRTKEKFEVICLETISKNNETLNTYRYPVRVIRINKKEFNHGLTRDRGVREARGERIVFLTQDAVPGNEYWLKHLIENLADNNTAGVYSRQIPHPFCHPLARYHLESYIGTEPARRIQFVPFDKKFSELDPWEKFKLVHFANVSSCMRRDIWEKFKDVYGSHEGGTNLCYFCRVILFWMPLVFLLHAALLAATVFVLIILPIRLFNPTGYGNIVATTVAIAAIIATTIVLVKWWRSMRGEGLVQRVVVRKEQKEPSFVSITWTWVVSQERKICPLIKFYNGEEKTHA